MYESEFEFLTFTLSLKYNLLCVYFFKFISFLFCYVIVFYLFFILYDYTLCMVSFMILVMVEYS